jgi:hypothetical protein
MAVDDYCRLVNMPSDTYQAQGEWKEKDNDSDG